MRDRLTALDRAILAVAAIVTAIVAWLTFLRATTPWASMPDADYWGNIHGLITEAGVRLEPSALLHHNNEHIVLIPKLIYAANYFVTSGSNIGLIVYSLLAGAACTALLVLLARETLIETPWRFLLCALLFPLVMFSAKLTHSYFLGMSGTIWLTADLFVIASVACLARAISTGRSGWLLLSLAAALLGILTYSTAVYALLVLLIYCVAKLLRPKLPGPSSWLLLLGTASMIVLVLGLGLAYRNQPSHHPALEFDPLGLIRFVLIYLGNALTTGPPRIAVGIVIVVAGGLAIRALAAQGRVSEMLLWIVLFLFAPFNALMTGIGRLGNGVKMAAASRYQTVTAISLIAAITLILAALPRGAESRRAVIWRSAVFATLLVCAAVIALNRSHLDNFAARNERKALAEIALRQGIESDRHLEASTPAAAQLERVLPALRAVQHAPFHWQSRCEDMLGRQVAVSDLPAAGYLEALSVYERSHRAGPAIELSGWAESEGAGAECIVIVDGSSIAIGSGVSVKRRPDIDRAKGRSLGRVGWKAVAVLPQTTPVCALALFPGELQLVPISHCETPDVAQPPADGPPSIDGKSLGGGL